MVAVSNGGKPRQWRLTRIRELMSSRQKEVEICRRIRLGRFAKRFKGNERSFRALISSPEALLR